MPSPAPDVDAFLAKLPPDVQAVLQQLRETIKTAAPESEERIGYGVPAFYYKKRPLVSYAAAKNHCAFYVQSPAVMEAHQSELAGYETAKGTVRFQTDAPLPARLVETLVKARMAETDAV
jgi:uncharacterized protein YdhG (YjbR/CyaY superfamily)